jgi:hypothetical protein
VAQDACLHAFLALDRLRDPDRFGAWLYGIVVNLCRMRLRARRATYSLEDWDGGRIAPPARLTEDSAEAVYEVHELHQRVLRAIELLPDEQRAVVRLHYLDGLTLAEIGMLAGSPIGTVKARLHRARSQLREKLRSELNELNPLFPAIRVLKEQNTMIEVIIQNVIMRVGQPKDVVEGASRELPGPEAPPFTIPLPPPPTGAPAMFFVKGDEQAAQTFNLPVPPMVHRVVVLKEKTGERLLPIWIGPHEADMIAMQLAEQASARPLTYELTARLLEATQATVQRVSVSQLKEEVFYATIEINVGGAVKEVDARPSDAFNLALRFKAPIFVAPEVMASQSVTPDQLDAKLNERETETFTWVSAPPPDLMKPKK